MSRKTIVLPLLGAVVVIAIIAAYFGLRTDRFSASGKDSIWYVESDANGDEELLVRGRKITEIRDDLDKLIIALNRATGEAESSSAQPGDEQLAPPAIRLQRTEDSVAYVEVLNAEYLTQRMGTAGAQAYLASVTYTLTEHPGIEAVNFTFPEGDHAVPGAYTRESFAEYEIKER